MKTEHHFTDWLPFLEHGLDLVLRPYPARLLRPGSSWYAAELESDLIRLRRARAVEAVGKRGAERAWRIVQRTSPKNRIEPAPEARWGRQWDGQWRILVFDLAREDQGYRSTLWRWLRSHRFGMLQYSVWISPDPLDAKDKVLRKSQADDRSLQVFEGHSGFGVESSRIVAKAWDFAAINLLYDQVMALHAEGLQIAETSCSPRVKRRWLAQERHAWDAAMFLDPLLPRELHPSDYKGPQALASRKAFYQSLAG